MSLAHAPSSIPFRKRRWRYFAHQSEFLVALHAMSYHGRARMMVLQEIATSRFVVITREEFERNWVEVEG